MILFLNILLCYLFIGVLLSSLYLRNLKYDSEALERLDDIATNNNKSFKKVYFGLYLFTTVLWLPIIFRMIFTKKPKVEIKDKEEILKKLYDITDNVKNLQEDVNKIEVILKGSNQEDLKRKFITRISLADFKLAAVLKDIQKNSIDDNKVNILTSCIKDLENIVQEVYQAEKEGLL